MTQNETILGSTVLTALDQWRAFYLSAHRVGRICYIVAIICLVWILAASQTLGLDGIHPLPIIAGLLSLASWPLIILYGHSRLSDAQKQARYEIDAEQIVLRDAAGTVVALPWSVARGCVETKSGFFVSVRPADGRWLPKRAFAADRIAALRALIGQKLGDLAELKRS